MTRLALAVLAWCAVVWLALCGIVQAQTAPSDAWTIEDMNATVDQSNFIVAEGCSGTLISVSERLILTNYHCIERFVRVVERERADSKGRMQKIREVKLDPVPVRQNAYRGHEAVGSSTFVTEIVARKQSRDIAVLRIKAETIPHTRPSPLLPPGASVDRGEAVWIVGNPAGLDATVVSGIVSSTTRMLRTPWAENEDLPFIQFSGGIFGGNSGGALYNARGQAIGVPAASLATAFLGFAVPSEVVWEVLADHCLAGDIGGTDNAEMCKDGELIEAGDEEAAEE